MRRTVQPESRCSSSASLTIETAQPPTFEIIADPSNTVPVRTAVQQAGLDYESAEVLFVPEYTQEVDAATAEKLMKIIDALDDSDDVQNVYANFDASDEVLAKIS